MGSPEGHWCSVLRAVDGVLSSSSEQQDVVSTKSAFSSFPATTQTRSDQATLGLQTSVIKSSKKYLKLQSSVRRSREKGWFGDKAWGEKKDENWTRSLCSGETGYPYPCLACGAAVQGRTSLPVSVTRALPLLRPWGALSLPVLTSCVYTPNTHVCSPSNTPPKIHRHTPQTHVLTQPPRHYHHIPTRSLHFSRGRRQGKTQEVKVSPHLSIISSLKLKQSKNY